MNNQVQLLLCRTIDQRPPHNPRESECAVCSNRIWISGVMSEPVSRGEVLPICHECVRDVPAITNTKPAVHPRQLAALAERGPAAQTAAGDLVGQPALQAFDQLLQGKSVPVDDRQ